MNKSRFKSYDEKIKIIEKMLDNHNYPKEIKEIDFLPFNNLQELRELYDSKKLLVSVDLKTMALEIISSKGDYIYFHFLATFWVLCAITCLIIFFVNFNGFILFGIPAAFVGSSLSSPYNKSRYSLLSFTILLFIISLLFSFWSCSIIFGSFIVSLIFTIASREYYNILVENIMLKSEIIFCYLFVDNVIVFKDKNTQKIYKYI